MSRRQPRRRQRSLRRAGKRLAGLTADLTHLAAKKLVVLALTGLALGAFAAQSAAQTAEDPETQLDPPETAHQEEPPVIELSPEDFADEESLEEFLRVTVVTASLLEEPLYEAPVPVTVVTSEMIRASGARNLQEILYTYVPGMTDVVDHNETNIAMRGIYASSQQKILVLLDGHRLNSRAYSMANPDYSISIDPARVKQIEILRGPGSSLYGNVALTAVINIISKRGADADGATVTVGAGDFVSRNDTHPFKSQDRLLAAGKAIRFTQGAKFGKHDLFLWGGLFHADGQTIPVTAAEDYSDKPQDGYAIVGGVKDPSAYDLGVKYSVEGISLLANLRHAKTIEPFSGGGDPTGEVYTYDHYRTFDGVGPGLGSRSGHLEVRYDKKIRKDLLVSAMGYYDTNDLAVILIIDPAVRRYGNVAWNEHAVGSILQTSYDYGVEVAGSGNFTAGIQVDWMRVPDSHFLIGVNGDWSQPGDSAERLVLERGEETIYSAFAEIKHRLSERWLLNLGARGDIKDRHQGQHVEAVSPRLAAVWTWEDWVNAKLSYAQSFVDAPYFYRYNSLMTYQGSSGLTPEYLRSLQFTPTLHLWGGRLQNTVNIFYNHVFDFVFRVANVAPGDPQYINAASLQSAGVEEELALLFPHWRVRANATYQYALEGQDFDARGGEIFNVPSLVGNVILSGSPLPDYRNLAVSLSARFVGEQLAPIKPTFRSGMSFEDPANRVGAYVLFNTGLRISNLGTRGLNLDATLYNVADQRYSQGGSVVFPYPQPGRSFFVTLSYHFRP